ncbi:putative lipase YDL109C [[Candida] anglica]
MPNHGDSLNEKDSIDKKDILLYRQTKAVKCGQIERFIITYTPNNNKSNTNTSNPIPPNLWLKVKNKESIALRAAYLAGPYVLYVDCTPMDYHSEQQCFVTADQPVFEPQLLPGQSVYAELACHSIKSSYSWTVDVVSQTIFNNTIDVDFEISIGTSKQVVHDLSFPMERPVTNGDKTGVFVPPSLLSVTNHDTLDLWNLPIPSPSKPIHLVILTHGLHSNVSADMLYLKDQIDRSCKGDNVVVKGFFGNVGKTERGIKYLGSRVAEFVVDLVTKNGTFANGKVDRISFVGHSLGGLVQTFAIAYIENNFPWFFKQIQPINFITIASPLLGVVHENPMYVKLALSAGFVGKTGQDLGLVFLENNSPPLLLLLPTGPTHSILKMFKRRTVYANVKNDGIVPLRTSALLYLDYKGLSQIMRNNTNTESSDDGSVINSTMKIPSTDQIHGDSKNSNNNGKESNGLHPLQAMLSFFMPQKQSSQGTGHGQYQRFQTGVRSGGGANDEDGNLMAPGDSFEHLSKSSVLETATSLILPPLPSFKYITDPSSRENVIVHDKVYQESDLPPREVKQLAEEESSAGILERIGLPSLRLGSGDDVTVAATEASSTTTNGASNSPQSTMTPSLRKRLMNSLDKDVEYLEEEIAREYHKHMSWRKVLVQLLPDAHNNIIVRRRYANAYGWPVIEHLVSNHFAEGVDKDTTLEECDQRDSLDEEGDLSRILSRDLITKQNDDIDESTKKDHHHWINSEDNAESLFAVGPTGLLSDVSEMMGNFKDQWYNYQRGVVDSGSDVQAAPSGSKDEDMGSSRQVMGDFI